MKILYFVQLRFVKHNNLQFKAAIDNQRIQFLILTFLFFPHSNIDQFNATLYLYWLFIIR